MKPEFSGEIYDADFTVIDCMQTNDSRLKVPEKYFDGGGLAGLIKIITLAFVSGCFLCVLFILIDTTPLADLMHDLRDIITALTGKLDFIEPIISKIIGLEGALFVGFLMALIYTKLFIDIIFDFDD